MRVSCEKTEDFSENLFTPHDRSGIWLSCEKNSVKIFTNVSPQGFRMQNGVMGYKKCNFRPISHFISEMIQNMATLTMEDE